MELKKIRKVNSVDSTSVKNLNRGATFSKCKIYRYRLWRIWDAKKPTVLFIMLNPSTAGSTMDDPTIKRCIGFAKSWGYGGLYVGNLFAYRSTQPKGLLKLNDAEGKQNQTHLLEMSKLCKIGVCAWGNQSIINKIIPNYQLKNLSIPLFYIELSKGGTPKHPLYLNSNLRPKPL